MVADLDVRCDSSSPVENLRPLKKTGSRGEAAGRVMRWVPVSLHQVYFALCFKTKLKSEFPQLAQSTGHVF